MFLLCSYIYEKKFIRVWSTYNRSPGMYHKYVLFNENRCFSNIFLISTYLSLAVFGSLFENNVGPRSELLSFDMRYILLYFYRTKKTEMNRKICMVYKYVSLLSNKTWYSCTFRILS